MKVPTKPWTLLYKIKQETLPVAHEFLNEWTKKADEIPNAELREQALASIKAKTFHCEGGTIFGLVATDARRRDVIRFIVAYQTISDYLDNLCDRSTSLEERDFRSLHRSMYHALTPGETPDNYYEFRDEQEDGGYLASLVMTCQNVLEKLPGFMDAQAAMRDLSAVYCDLQVYKHIDESKREEKLEDWFAGHKQEFPPMTWYEFSACAGSTLGIFCLSAYASKRKMIAQEVEEIKDAYFPWVQGLHIMLDYFIDQVEDRQEGDLNFVFYYESEEQMVKRFRYIKEHAEHSVQKLPDAKFHQMVTKGLPALYLSDKKVQENKELKRTAKRFIRFGGLPTAFFYLNRGKVAKQPS
ncbi:tetraprenyl-beta-curcumene synthase family protein [Salicibibacter cibi]|uniref:Tetraprenyl-beta-curcumene synthase family protein n=1 Tax=Salicibibacter cibi TaxID=2743001 RepID=A0A7T6ZEQ8_9BACI|nr:tetraprenyl-beta-curcumene synthase family protein [Salicibibacter cibi]QQK82027.1 tetraprenyl-beta-curcumene synthase family protein [Salicibibacter cibi]